MLSARFLSRSVKCVLKTQLKGPLTAFSTTLGRDHEQVSSSMPRKEFSVDGLFGNSFHYKGNHGATSAVTGQYVAVTEADINLMPEGFAGEVEAEFEAHGAEDAVQYWMIRDSTKLVCRLLDEFKARGSEQPVTAVATSQQLVDLEDYGLRSDTEWHDAVMGVERYGNALVEKPMISFKAGGDMYMDRPEGDLVQTCMDRMKERFKRVPDKILLAGPRGVGKSFALNQAVLHARKNGWLVLFVPRGWEQVQAGSFVQPALLEGRRHKNKSPITFKVTKLITSQEELEEFDVPKKVPVDKKTVFDNHEMSAAALRGLLQAHAPQLRSVPIRDTAILQKYAPYRVLFQEAFDRVTTVDARVANMPFVQIRALIEMDDGFPEVDKLDVDVLKNFVYNGFEPKTLEDLALLGVALRELSGSLFIDLVSELKALDRPDMPVLFAVDQYNTWEVDSAFSYDGTKIPGKKLAVPHALNFLSLKRTDSMHWKMANGFCIGATSLRHVEGRKADFKRHKTNVPLMVTVPQYNAQEMLSVTSYMVERKVLIPFIEASDIATMRMFCGSNPRLIREQGAKQLFEKMVTLSDEIYGNEDEADEEVVYAEDYEGPLKVTDDVVAVRHRASEHRRRALDSDSESDGFSAPESDFSDGDNFEDDTDSDGADSDASDEEGEFEEGEEQEYEGESEEDEKIAKTKSK